MEEGGFDDRFVFSDEANSHISGKINKDNTRIWGSKNPYLTLQHVRDSPKANVLCAMTKKRVDRPFVFEEGTVNGEAYLAILQNWLIEKFHEEESADLIFQEKRATTSLEKVSEHPST